MNALRFKIVKCSPVLTRARSLVFLA